MQDDKSPIIVYPDEEEKDDPFFGVPPLFGQENLSGDAGSMYDFDRKIGKNQPFLQTLRLLYKELVLLKNGMKPKNIVASQKEMLRIMDESTKRLSELGYENTDIMIVRYILATFIDEQMGSIEWPDGEAWANHSLLGHYYQETYGGEKFFQLLAHFAKDPDKYLEHMKLIYACLSLGYKGRYSISNHTDIKIEGIRQHLYERIKNHEKNGEKFYKEHPVSQIKHKLTLFVPYKFMFIAAFVIVAAVYGVFTTIVIDNERGLIDTLKKETLAASSAHDE